MSVAFTIEEDADAGRVIVTADALPFSINGREYAVPAGFRSDGASVPRFLWRVLSPPLDMQTLEPSIVHDYLYSLCGLVCTRQEADAWYRDALRANGYPWAKCQITYWGLRMFGGSHWRA